MLPPTEAPSAALRITASDDASSVTAPTVDRARCAVTRATVSFSMSLTAMAAATAAVPLPAAAPASDWMLDASSAVSASAPDVSSVDVPSARASVVFAMRLSVTEPPSAKIAPPATPTAAVYTSDSASAAMVMPPLPASAAESRTRARTVFSIRLPLTAAPAAPPLAPTASAMPPAIEMISDVSAARSCRRVAALASAPSSSRALTLFDTRLSAAEPAIAASLLAESPAAAPRISPVLSASMRISPARVVTRAPTTCAVVVLPMSLTAAAAPTDTLPAPATEPARPMISVSSVATTRSALGVAAFASSSTSTTAPLPMPAVVVLRTRA